MTGGCVQRVSSINITSPPSNMLSRPFRADLVAALAALACHSVFLLPLRGEQFATGPWKRNGLATERFTITGTGGRNNPLRRAITPAFAGDELFVRFHLRYDANSIDTPPDGTGEFLVLWLDREEGSDGSTHSNNVPNLGIHVKDETNHFMIRLQRVGAEIWAAARR